MIVITLLHVGKQMSSCCWIWTGHIPITSKLEFFSAITYSKCFKHNIKWKQFPAHASLPVPLPWEGTSFSEHVTHPLPNPDLFRSEQSPSCPVVHRLASWIQPSSRVVHSGHCQHSHLPWNSPLDKENWRMYKIKPAIEPGFSYRGHTTCIINERTDVIIMKYAREFG